jgi:hypothetical protein
MTNRTAQYRVESEHTARVKWEPTKTIGAVLGNVEYGVGPVALGTPINLPLRVFQQIIDEHRAGKKSRI